MIAFRLLLVTLLVVLIAYTAAVIADHGWNLFPQFFGDIGRMGWPGQFNADFSMLLVLSGLWTAWRNGFGAGGIALGLLAALLGTLFLATYLIYLGWREGGDVPHMLVGDRVRGAY